MPEKRWKSEEKRIARFLGLDRRTALGRAGVDAEGKWLVVEVKDRQRQPGWLHLAVSKAKVQAGEGRLGIVVLTGPTELHDLVVLELRDFRDWFGGAK